METITRMSLNINFFGEISNKGSNDLFGMNGCQAIESC